MDFDFTEDQLAFRETARQFAEKELAPNAAQWDAESIFPVDVIKASGDLGFCGLYSPESVGGLALSRLDSSLIFEELSQACTSTTAFITIHNMATWMVTSFAQSPNFQCRSLYSHLLVRDPSRLRQQSTQTQKVKKICRDIHHGGNWLHLLRLPVVLLQ